MTGHLILTATDNGSDPINAAVSVVLGYGVLGIVTLVFAWLFYRGWRLAPPDRESALAEKVRAEARADLLDERARVLAEKTRTEQERDDAQQFTRAQLIPLLVNFTNATSALIPLLQDLVKHREAGDLDQRRRQR